MKTILHSLHGKIKLIQNCSSHNTPHLILVYVFQRNKRILHSSFAVLFLVILLSNFPSLVKATIWKIKLQGVQNINSHVIFQHW